MANEALVLVHLSDIHFNRHTTGDAYDLDAELRDGLSNDSAALRNELGNANAILVTGDIAFSGRADEFEIAGQWLESLSRVVGCAIEDIWTTPGNHDVDWTVIRESEVLQTLYDSLCKEPLFTLDRKVNNLLRDRAADLFAPLHNYNEFAAPFQCRVTHERPNSTGDLILNDGSILRLVGLNSTLVSSSLDHERDRPLILGSYQTSFARKPGVEYLTLCHHPPSWLRDGAGMAEALNAKTRIQLFGHRHLHAVENVGGSIVVAAGAVQPERYTEEGWEPHYNWIRASINQATGLRSLCVEVAPRVWDRRSSRFVGHGDTLRFEIPLDAWVQAAREPIGIEVREVIEEELTTGTPEDRNAALHDRRRLYYRFFRLPYGKAVAIAQELGLFDEADRTLKGAELLNAILRRATERQLVEELRRRLDAEEDSD